MCSAQTIVLCLKSEPAENVKMIMMIYNRKANHVFVWSKSYAVVKTSIFSYNT